MSLIASTPPIFSLPESLVVITLRGFQIFLHQTAQQTGVFCAMPRSAGPRLCDGAQQLRSQPAYPFVVRPGQLDVALGVDHRSVAQPFLQHGDRNAPQHAVAAVGVPEGVGVGPGGVDP